MPQAALSPAGEILRSWRAVRGMSQLGLALEAEVSPRHLSFIETGRSAPSREMLLRLSETLDMPLRERNALLQAAGFAAIYKETPLHAPPMAHVRKAIDGILRAHARCPALLVNPRYDVLEVNHAAKRLMAGAALPDPDGRPPNLLRLLLAPECLRPAIENWPQLAASLIRRIWRESEGSGSLRRDLLAIVEECCPGGARALLRDANDSRPADVILPIRVRTPDGVLALFSTITTLGTATDITLQELRIEAFHPADAASEEYLARIIDLTA